MAVINIIYMIDEAHSYIAISPSFSLKLVELTHPPDSFLIYLHNNPTPHTFTP